MINIRPMTKKDKPAIIRILQNTPEFLPAEVVVADEVIDSYLFNPQVSGYFILVVEVDSIIAGYVCYGPTPMTEDTWDLYWIAVDRKYRGMGLGKTLLQTAENKVKADKGRLLVIETSSKPEYDRTNQFYLLQGYKAICQIVDFYAVGDNKIFYEKRFK